MIGNTRFKAVLLAALASTPNNLNCQGIFIPEPEAPTTIFQTKLGDAEIDLNLQGSWDAALGLGFGLLFAPGLPIQVLDAFPGIEVGIAFHQTPNLTASAVLMNRYFLDLSIQQDPLTAGTGRNFIVMGYRGEPPEIVRSVMLGNGGIEIPPSDFLQIPAQPASSLGASAILVSGTAANEFLLRWDSAEERSKTFIGTNELLEEIKPLDSYIRGLHFFLPDAAVDPASLAVFIEDPRKGTITADDGRVYRYAGIEDVSMDAAAGTVSLKSLQKGRVLAFYRKGGLAIGTPFVMGVGALPGQSGTRRDLSAAAEDFTFLPAVAPNPYLGQDMSHRRVNLADIGDCLLLWEPGDNSPFEIDSSYAFENLPPEDPARIRIQLEAKQAGVTLPQVSFRPLPDQNRFVVYADPDFRADFRNMYPFPDLDGLLYGPRRDSLSGYLAYEIRVQLLTPANEVSLEPNIVPGSVRVFINGVAETRFQADPASGRLTFLIDIHDTDRIDVSYRVSSAGLSGGAVLFAWRDTLTFSEALILTLGAGIRWNADPWSFSQKPYSKSGTILAQAGLQGSGEKWSYSVQAGLAYTNPDTSGLLRLFGMEGNSLAVDLGEESAYPAAPPDPAAAGAPAGLSQLNRAALYYKDYRSYDVLGGSTLNPATWPGFTLVPYENGGRMGPYNVSGSPLGPGTGKSLVFDFDVPIGQWAGAQLPVVAGGDTDLSSARTVTIQYQALDVAGSFDVYLQAGSLSEDIDGSGSVSSETSSTDSGFAFLEQTLGITLRVGGGPKGEGNGRLDSEDRNLNEILDRENPDGTVTAQFPVAASTLAWQTYSRPLTSEERSRLVSARQLRIVITSAAGAKARLIVGGISFEGAAEYGAAGGWDADDYVRETPETASIYDPGSSNRLADVFPAVDAFHPSGEPQEVLEARWNGITTPLVITGYSGVGTGGIQYGSVGVYLRLPNALPGALIEFELMDTAGRGISWTVDPTALARIPAGPWHEMEVASSDGRVRVDGVDIAVSQAPVFDAGYGDLRKLEVTIADPTGVGPPPNGVLLLDELQCRDPVGALGAALSAEASLEAPEVLEIGGVDVLSNVSVRQKLALISPGFSPLYGIPAAAEDIYSKTEIGADALFTRISLGMLLREYAGSFTASGSHRLTIPSVSFPVKLTDAFSLNGAGEISRENSIEIRPSSSLSLEIDAKADAAEAAMNQSWNGKLSFSPVSQLHVSSSVGASQSLSGYPLAPFWYGQRWIQEMGLAIPWPDGEDIYRREALGFDVKLLPVPFGFEASAEAQAQSSGFSRDQFEQENSLALSLRLLLRLGSAAPDIFTVGLGYGRTVRLRTMETAGERFISEAASFASVIGAQTYLIAGIPYFELFEEDSTLLPLWFSAFKASYEPKATLSFERGFGSRLWDLFIPYSLDLSIGRKVEKDGNLSSADITIAPRVASHALNLFGQLGAYPLVPFARTDEYGLSLGASIASAPDAGFRLEQMTADVFASLEGFGDVKITFTNSCQMEGNDRVVIADTTRFELDWAVRPAGGLSISWAPPEMMKTAFFSHEESAEATVRYSSVGAYDAFTLALAHSTALVMPENGSIKAKARIGYDLENLLAGAFASRIGVILELEAKLRF